MKSYRNPILLALVVGGTIGYLAACNNSTPATDATAAPAETGEQETVPEKTEAATATEATDPPTKEPVQVAQTPTAVDAPA
jgi:hypothetical protein